MPIPKVLAGVAMALVFGLAIGLPFGWGLSQFHHSSQSPPVQSAEIQGHPACCQPRPPESYWDKLETDPVAGGTFLLCLITGVLAAYTAGLFTATARLAREAKETGDKQAIIAEKQTAIIESQHLISRRQFMAEHRPRLRVRNISISSTARDGSIFLGRELSGHCYIDNIGGMTAVIEELFIGVYANQMGLPMDFPFEGAPGNISMTENWFNIGQSRRCDFVRPSPFATAEEAERAATGAFPLFALGWILYRDESDKGTAEGVGQRYAFCRRWDASKRRFVPIENDPDYEYET
jgi:hypothetical protein